MLKNIEKRINIFYKKKTVVDIRSINFMNEFGTAGRLFKRVAEARR